ncbi:MAG: toxin-antitoxin system protein [Microcystis panniformis]|uniref:toxin-antitoxin system protein n=1 Tax=Microcystis aeruginosa TaxID=1126 RepID=UPI0021AB6017|nr:toxin-antitoxin system protein [Microcystis aeruginosa]
MLALTQLATIALHKLREKSMPELKISISEAAHKTLLALVDSSGDTLPTVLDKAIENYRRYVFLVQANEAFAALRKNETLWQEEISERQTWEQTLADGVEG